MTTTVRAVYSQGVFKPAAPVSIAEGTEVELTISSEAPTANGMAVLAVLRRIAALPPESPDDGFSGADHDSALYPDKDR